MNTKTVTAVGAASAILVAVLTTLVEVSIPELFGRFISRPPSSSASTNVSVTVSVPTQQSGFRVNYLYLDKRSSQLKPILPGSVLYSGDRYKIDFTPDRDGHVYIFQVDSAGQFFKLFPMQTFKGVAVNQVNPVRSGQRYVLPAVDKSFKLDATTGRERLFFVFSAGPHQELESLAERLDQARRQSDPAAISVLNRDLEVRLEGETGKTGGQQLSYRGLEQIESDEVVTVAWDSEENVFNVLGMRLENLCNDCVYGIEFEHK